MITMTMTTPNSTSISNPTTTPITPPPPSLSPPAEMDNSASMYVCRVDG